MRLKKLEISGFKSFAHKTNLEFPGAISAIVGPNGSGKSNVVDAVRWVLGEQSFKNLRSKSGSDLIWAGSTTKSAQGKAGVSLHFDNRDGFFPIDFEDVIVSRKVYRDGANEYYLNDSQVRLKDITELLARSKLGLRGHSIVNQGSADEILKSNSQERRSILEEALGLREFQLKKSEAEAKLTETGINLEQTASILNEISPHLRSLKRQVDKFSRREDLIRNVDNLENEFYQAKVLKIISDRNNNQKAKEKLASNIALARENFQAREKLFETRIAEISQTGGKTKQIELDLNKLNAERQNIMRDLGRLEGIALHAKRNNDKNVKTLEAVLAIKIKYWAKRLGAARELSDIDGIKEIIEKLSDEIQIISNYFEKNETDKILALVNLTDLEKTDENPYTKDGEELKAKLEQLENKTKQLQNALFGIRSEEDGWRTSYLAAQKELELARREYVLAEEAMGKFNLEDEKIKLREDDIRSEMWGSGKNYEDFLVRFANAELTSPEALIKSDSDLMELGNKIAKLRREIADIGNIDGEVIKEYEETNNRHKFLTAEVDDLSHAKESLKDLICNLTSRINNDFQVGITRINEEFNHYFRLMFGGGAAKLAVNNSGDDEAGVDIGINIPQKRVKDLNLLSGGERSLVSIALLFAIVSASRPPFLILDEIDAALDEANAARFAKVLRDLAKDTQFVLITHNRATMEAAEILYGVAMDGDGVSKLFSLKLEESA